MEDRFQEKQKVNNPGSTYRIDGPVAVIGAGG